MKNLTKLLLFTLILTFKSVYTLELLALKKKRSCEPEIKVKQETKSISDKMEKINAYRSKCLEQYIPKVLSDIVQQYDPLEDKWEYEQTLNCSNYFCVDTDDTRPPIKALCMLDENKLAAGYDDGTITIWNLKTCKPEQSLKGGYSYIISICKISENEFASICRGNLKIWDIKTNECKKELTGRYQAMCLLSENKLILGDENGKIEILNTQTYSIEFVNYGSGIYNRTRAICLLEKNKFAVGYQENMIKILNLDTNSETNINKPKSCGAIGVCALPKNKLLIVWFIGVIGIFNLETSKFEKSFGEDNIIKGICLLPNNKLATFGYMAKDIKIWNLETGKCEQEIPIATRYDNSHGDLYTLGLLSEYKLAAGTMDGQIHIFTNTIAPMNIPEETSKNDNMIYCV